MEDMKVKFGGFKLTPEQTEALASVIGPDGAAPPLSEAQRGVIDRIIDEIERRVNDPESQLNIARNAGITTAEDNFVKGLDIQAQITAEMIVASAAFSSATGDQLDIKSRALGMLTVLSATVIYCLFEPDAGRHRVVAQLAKTIQNHLRLIEAEPELCKLQPLWMERPE